MTAYISVSFNKRKAAEPAINSIIAVLNKFNIAPFVFVDKYKFEPAAEKEMMQQALTDIDNCDIFIAEVSDKAIGIGVEAGYAKAKGKLVIYTRQKDAEHSTTVSGISDYKIIYEDIHDLRLKLAGIMEKIVAAKK